MYQITLLNKKTGEKNTKYYDSYYFYEKELNKIKHSKELDLISHGKVYY